MATYCPGCEHKDCIGFVNCSSPAKGKPVAEYKFPQGRAVIMDAAFVNATPEELKQRERHLQAVALNIAVAAYLRGDL